MNWLGLVVLYGHDAELSKEYIKLLYNLLKKVSPCPLTFLLSAHNKKYKRHKIYYVWSNIKSPKKCASIKYYILYNIPYIHRVTLNLHFAQRSGMEHFIPKKKKFYSHIESISHSHFPLSNSVWKMEYKQKNNTYMWGISMHISQKFLKLYVPTTKRQVFIASLPHKTSSDLTAIAIYSIQPSPSHIHTPSRESHTSFVKLLCCCCWWWCVFNREQLRNEPARMIEKILAEKEAKKLVLLPVYIYSLFLTDTLSHSVWLSQYQTFSTFSVSVCALHRFLLPSS